MKNLKSLTFTAATKQSNTDPVARKRNKLIARLVIPPEFKGVQK
jgi:hypothetical protein